MENNLIDITEAVIEIVTVCGFLLRNSKQSYSLGDSSITQAKTSLYGQRCHSKALGI